MPHNLSQLQRWLQAVIMHPHGIAAGIKSAEAREEIAVLPGDVEQVIGRSQALTSIERLEIYGNAYYSRLLECLRESFPVLAGALGNELFDQFAMAYLQAYPSTSYTLSQLGANFARHLEETRPDRDELAPGEVSWPDFLIDVARLEWAIGEVFDGPGVERAAHSDEVAAPAVEAPVVVRTGKRPESAGTRSTPNLASPPPSQSHIDDRKSHITLDPATLAAIPPEQWPAARLVPVPCLRLLEFRFPVNDYFTEHRKLRDAADGHANHAPAEDVPVGDGRLTLPEPCDSYLALTRINYVVRRIALSQPQYVLLSALVAGQCVGEAIEALVRTNPQSVDTLAADLKAWFAQWAAAGLFLRVELPG
ncbi:MAG: DNA-binding domain-containing protein [Planctomycetia bacterium]|nr:DNA-binding domain-containing protein [Planctomycetia bacterium]